MRILNLDGRLSLAVGDKAVDVETASLGEFSADVQAIYPRWDEFRTWAAGYEGAPDRDVTPSALGAPVPRPPQVFAIDVKLPRPRHFPSCPAI